uniref:Uncharacterized protein n=1 Tax=Arion vulgaris TaxID=1028688 RepID=A0A0B7AP31_9EUPU
MGEQYLEVTSQDTDLAGHAEVQSNELADFLTNIAANQAGKSMNRFHRCT